MFFVCIFFAVKTTVDYINIRYEIWNNINKCNAWIYIYVWWHMYQTRSREGKLLICENKPRVRVDILCDISVWGIDAFVETCVLHSFDCSNVWGVVLPKLRKGHIIYIYVIFIIYITYITHLKRINGKPSWNITCQFLKVNAAMEVSTLYTFIFRGHDPYRGPKIFMFLFNGCWGRHELGFSSCGAAW